MMQIKSLDTKQRHNRYLITMVSCEAQDFTTRVHLYQKNSQQQAKV